MIRYAYAIISLRWLIQYLSIDEDHEVRIDDPDLCTITHPVSAVCCA